jgi:hypothetical protein
MANPNIAALSSILGANTTATPSNTSANVLFANASGSGTVIRINTIMVANTTSATATNATVAINSAAGGGGTSYPIVSTVGVPGSATLTVVDKTTAIYLTENQSIVVTSSVANNLTFIASYETIS